MALPLKGLLNLEDMGDNHAPMATVKKGDTVQLFYIGRFTDGTIFHTGKQKAPYTITIGKGDYLPEFEKAVIGMTPGQKKKITIKAANAFGTYNEDLVFEIPWMQVGLNTEPEIGRWFNFAHPDGRKIRVKVIDVNDKGITVDANHPFMGKDLIFEITLFKIL